MNPLSKNRRRPAWKEAMPGNAYLSFELARLEDALQGLHALTRLLDNDHTESMEEDKTQSYALGDYMAGALHSAAASLALYAYDHLGTIREHCAKRSADKC